MNRIPFSVYDFFGYLAAGFLVIAALALAFRQESILTAEPSVLSTVILVLAAYLVGQILANPSAWLLERTIIGRFLGRPNEILFAPLRTGWLSRLFPGYFSPLPTATQQRILQKATEKASITSPGEGLFFHAFGLVKRDEWTMPRLNNFLNLYGFCRNTSFASLVSAFIFLVSAWWWRDPGQLLWMVVALIIAVGMFYRYLKFFRQYSVELFISYSELAP